VRRVAIPTWSTIALALVLVLVLGALQPARADDPARVEVSPSTGLAGGHVVRVSADGLPAGVTVEVIQCDTFDDNIESDCYPAAFVEIGDDGSLSLDLTLSDPVYHQRAFGDPAPVYCRADGCHIFVVWNRAPETGGTRVLASEALDFNGSPATIMVHPSTNLHRKNRVWVSGTAVGAESRTVQIVEEACFSIVQGSGCYGGRLIGSTTVRSDGTWWTRAKVSRFLSDGTDCADPGILGACEISVTVLGSNGVPDDSFGVSSRGQPAAWITFRTCPEGSR
jgi:hypothetical protein